MAKFIYKTMDDKGNVREGTVSSTTKRGAKKKIKSPGSEVISIYQDKSGSFLTKLNLITAGGFTKGEYINFFRNLSAMIASGVSIVEALEILSEQVKSEKAKRAILTIVNETRNGQKLAKAMARFPKYFSESIVETINTGDVSGRLIEVLNNIADDLEKDDELKKKVIGALAYPAVITVVMIIVLIAFAFYILPGIDDMFKELGAPVPLPTKIILMGSDFIKKYPAALFGTILGIIILFFISLKIKKTHYIIHQIILRLPLFGELIKEYNLILLFRSLETLYASGISLAYSVEIAKKTTTNDVYKKILGGIQPILLHGVPFSGAISPFPFLFSRQTQRIIWVGEKTGKMGESLNRIVDYYEHSVDYRTRMLTVLIEPILMVIIGIVVGGLALSIFMPIYGMIKVI